MAAGFKRIKSMSNFDDHSEPNYAGECKLLRDVTSAMPAEGERSLLSVLTESVQVKYRTSPSGERCLQELDMVMVTTLDIPGLTADNCEMELEMIGYAPGDMRWRWRIRIKEPKGE
jgi:hypothetical protein